MICCQFTRDKSWWVGGVQVIYFLFSSPSAVCGRDLQRYWHNWTIFDSGAPRLHAAVALHHHETTNLSLFRTKWSRGLNQPTSYCAWSYNCFTSRFRVPYLNSKKSRNKTGNTMRHTCYRTTLYDSQHIGRSTENSWRNLLDSFCFLDFHWSFDLFNVLTKWFMVPDSIS